MRRVFQLIRADNGTRSPPVITTREELAQLLHQGVEGLASDDLVLCVGDLSGDQLEVGAAPLMRVDTFCNNFGASSNG